MHYFWDKHRLQSLVLHSSPESPSQTQDEFETYKSNLKVHLDVLLSGNLFVIVIIGDFNVKSKDCCWNNKTNFECSILDFLTSQFCLSQRIKEPTHIIKSWKSCINLIFTCQPNWVIDSAVQDSLHSNCHQQIIYVKFNLKIFYLSPYGRVV